MSIRICRSWKWPFLGVTLLAAGILVSLVLGQSVPPWSGPPILVGGMQITGIPEDWSDHFAVFANPGTEEQAFREGRWEQWNRVVNQPRYVLQQLKRNAPVQGPAAPAVESRRAWWRSYATVPATPLEAPEQLKPLQLFPTHPSRPIRSTPAESTPAESISMDWSVSLGGPGLAVGHFPAKYTFSPLNFINTASCSDYVVFPTGAIGSGSGNTAQATIRAFNNLYRGGGSAGGSAPCGGTSTTPGQPTNYWAYNMGAAGVNTRVALSPVLSLDGSQVAFVMDAGTVNANGVTAGSNATLVLLKMPPLGTYQGAGTTGTLANVVRSGDTTGSGNAPNGLASVLPAAYRGCTAPCYTTFPLNAPDTYSAPFYVYGVPGDVIFVGTDNGMVHMLPNAFLGQLTSTSLDSATGWPVNLRTSTGEASVASGVGTLGQTGSLRANGSTALPNTTFPTSPVYDFGQGRVWLADSNGYIDWIPTDSNFNVTQGDGTIATCRNSSGGLASTMRCAFSSRQVGCANTSSNPNVTPGNRRPTAVGTGSNPFTPSNLIDLGFRDPPIVDVAPQRVYLPVGYGCANVLAPLSRPHPDEGGYIASVETNEPPGSFVIGSGSTGTLRPGASHADYENQLGGYGTNPTNPGFPLIGANDPQRTIARIGTLDNLHLAGINAGNFYSCVDGRLYRGPLDATDGHIQTYLSDSMPRFATPVSAITTTNTSSTINSGQAQADENTFMGSGSSCSAVSEFFNNGVDRMFISVMFNVQSNRGTGAPTPSCSGACVLMYNITTSLGQIPSGNNGPMSNQNQPYNAAFSLGSASQTAPRPTSGIIVDNAATATGASQIYFSGGAQCSFPNLTGSTTATPTQLVCATTVNANAYQLSQITLSQ